MPPGWGGIDTAAIAQDGNHLTHKFIVAEWRIVPEKGIAAGHQTVVTFADEPVGHKLLLAVAEHNAAWNQIRGIALFYGKDVAGPDGGEHAGPGYFQANLTGRRCNLCNQTAFHRIAEIGWRVHHSDHNQEFFLLLLHAPWVGLSFPQLSAMVSKTFS
jgi:hypothetical protein